MSKCLIIVGMHRSGTSFTASLLQNAGLDVGEKFIEKNNGNPKGYFENEEFCNFHIKVLQENKLDQNGWDLKTIPFQKKYEQETRELVTKIESSNWGWKDPRTTLFLNFWKQLLPDACFLFVFRPPWEVVDSIYRRGDEVFNSSPEKAIEIWTFYNQVALTFYENNRDKSALYHLEDIINEPAEIIAKLNYRFDLNLKLQDKRIFDEEIFNQKNMNQAIQQAIVERYSPTAMQIYARLQDLNEGRKIFEKQIAMTLVNSKIMYRHWYQLNQKNKEINNLTKIISWMKDSKFWKMRDMWLKIKKFSVPQL